MAVINAELLKNQKKGRKTGDEVNVRSKRNHTYWVIGIYIFLILLTINSLFPMVWLLNFSLVKSGELYGPEIMKWPNPFQWVNYHSAWVDGQIPHYFINSVIVVGLSVFLSVLFSFMLAYACTRMEWKLRTFVYGIALTGMMIPIHATLLPNFQLFKVFGLLDTYLGLIIPYIAFTLPFNTLMLSGYLQSVHRSLEESALIDGCTNWGAMFKIVAPIIKPAIVTTTIITFINNWNEFIMARTYLSTENVRTLPFAVIKFNGQYSSQYAVQFAVMVCVAVPSLLVYFILSKYITEAVSQGAVKG